MAAEEARDPARDVPRGIVAAMPSCWSPARPCWCSPPGRSAREALSASGNPLVEALGDSTVGVVVNYIGLAGLVASFFSIIYAYSRQTFALSRAGYLPRVLSVTNSRKAPTLALLVPGLVGFLLSLTGQGAVLLNTAVFGAALSYVLMMVSHIVLRRREPDMPRPYRTPGGVADHRLRARRRRLRRDRDVPRRPVAACWPSGRSRCSWPTSPSTAATTWWPRRPTRSSRRSRRPERISTGAEPGRCQPTETAVERPERLARVGPLPVAQVDRHAQRGHLVEQGLGAAGARARGRGSRRAAARPRRRSGR